ncbi:MAG: MaoC/PaaZ C-terminal domain-containing protein [Bacteroidota bacterium]|jgi:acyl dehydratase
MYFESFHPGLHTITPRRTVNAAELDAFLDIADLHLPMFLSDESARELGHARRLVTGPMILAVAMGLVRATGWFDQVVAGLEFNEMRFRKAVHPGDTLQAGITVIEARTTRDPRRGLVVFSFEVSNQDDVSVLEMKGTYLFRTELALREKTGNSPSTNSI